MSVVVKYNGSTLTNAVQNQNIEGLSSAAKYGELGTGGLPLETATVIVGMKPITVDESACSVPRMFTGYIAHRPIRRLTPGTNALVWDSDLVDLNTLLADRIITGNDGKRPAETDGARVDWLMGSEYLQDPLIVDSGFVNTTTGLVNFGEADYRGQTPLAVLEDIAGISGKLFYPYWDEVTEDISLYYDLATATNRTSTLRISNDPADTNSTTFAPQEIPSVVRSPEDVASGVWYCFKGVCIYRHRGATKVAFRRHDLAYSTDRVGKLATAEVQAQAFLDLHDTEFDTIILELLLPAASVNLLTEGQRVQIKLTHLADYTSFVYLRVQRRTIGWESPGLYRVRFELSNNRLTSSGGGGGGNGGGGEGGIVNIPHRGAHWYEGEFVFLEDKGGWAGPLPPTDPDDTTISTTFDEGALFEDSTLYNYSITMTAPDPADYAPALALNSVFAFPPANISGMPGFASLPDPIGAGPKTVTGSFTTGNINNVDPLHVIASIAGTHFSVLTVTVHFWIDPDGWEGPAPAPGQPVNNETPTPAPDGTTTLFVTEWGYQENSLHVTVNGLQVVASETDPEAGEFTLPFAPQTGDAILVSYQGR